jgi:PAS domain S-box-containing protein
MLSSLPSPHPKKNSAMMNLCGESLSFKTLAHNISDAVVLTDADGSIAWTNPAFRKLCGYSHKEILGRKLGQLLQGKNTDTATAQALHDAVHNGQCIQSKILNYHKDGEAAGLRRNRARRYRQTAPRASAGKASHADLFRAAAICSNSAPAISGG